MHIGFQRETASAFLRLYYTEFVRRYLQIYLPWCLDDAKIHSTSSTVGEQRNACAAFCASIQYHDLLPHILNSAMPPCSTPPTTVLHTNTDTSTIQEIEIPSTRAPWWLMLWSAAARIIWDLWSLRNCYLRCFPTVFNLLRHFLCSTSWLSVFLDKSALDICIDFTWFQLSISTTFHRLYKRSI